MEVYEWLLSAITSSAVLAVAAYFGRDVIKAWLEKDIQHRFDRDIEALRANLRQAEELLKSDLRAKEAEIEALRSGALGGLANRQALLAKRRLEAAERIWSAVIDLGSAKSIAAIMSVMKFDVVVREAQKNPKVRQMFEMLGKGLQLDWPPKNVAKYERPFVTSPVWAMFLAFQTAVFYAVGQFKLLEMGLPEMGLEDASKVMNEENAKKVLKAALPHQATYIDQYGPTVFYHLLEEIEEKLISALRSMLEGADADQESVVQAAKIIKAVEASRADSIATKASTASQSI